MSKWRKFDLRKFSHSNKGHYYKQKAVITKIGYWYPDSSFSTEIKPCVWNKGRKDEYKGYPSCSLQLVCPFVNGHLKDGNLIRCNNQCKEPMMKEAIEAFISLNPEIF